MMTLWRPTLLGAGMVAATRLPAQWTAVRAGWSLRGRRGRGARVGLAQELPPQRVVGRPLALLCGGGGPCRGHTAAPVALRRHRQWQLMWCQPPTRLWVVVLRDLHRALCVRGSAAAHHGAVSRFRTRVAVPHARRATRGAARGQLIRYENIVDLRLNLATGGTF
eukprot:COSAG02_NODE_4921_length_4836_cov_2.655478_3_plen_165_part_00